MMLMDYSRVDKFVVSCLCVRRNYKFAGSFFRTVQVTHEKHENLTLSKLTNHRVVYCVCILLSELPLPLLPHCEISFSV